MEADLNVVVSAALGSVALSLLLLVATAAVRVAANRRAGVDHRLTEQWTPVFLGIAPPPVAQPLNRRDERAVLALWNRIRAAMRGPAAQPLVARGRAAGLHDVALRLLQSRRADDRLNAVAAVGTLGLPSAFPVLERFARRESSITLRSEACRSMLRLDAAQALPIVLDLLRTQSDWHPALIASVLDEADSARAARGLVDNAAAAIERGDVDVAGRLLRVLPAIDDPVCAGRVREILSETDEPDLQASCLLVLAHFADRRDRNVVRRYLASDVWYVRVHAAAALGWLGTHDDEPALTELLQDPEWWVRQRAAEALTRIAGMDPGDLAIVFEHHPEVGRFAGAPYSPVAEVLG